MSAIEDDTYPAVHLRIVQGQALRARASVLAHRGRYREASDFVARAEALPKRYAGAAYEERMAEAIHLVESKCDDSGRWPLEVRYLGVMPLEMGEEEGQPSRWNTLRALRVLSWARRDRHSFPKSV